MISASEAQQWSQDYIALQSTFKAVEKEICVACAKGERYVLTHISRDMMSTFCATLRELGFILNYKVEPDVYDTQVQISW